MKLTGILLLPLGRTFLHLVHKNKRKMKNELVNEEVDTLHK